MSLSFCVSVRNCLILHFLEMSQDFHLSISLQKLYIFFTGSNNFKYGGELLQVPS